MKLNTYQKVAVTTVGATLLLIFIGSLVRAAGVGLGCPDWPKCFGMWIPPTSPAELPSGYDPARFSVFKTWMEYINRLVGVVIGLLITATALISVPYRKSEPAVFYSSVAAFILVLVQGWLGGQVVKSGLSEWLITLHMLLAITILNILMYAAFKASKHNLAIRMDDTVRRWLFGAGVALFALTLVQMVFGTQVREAVDIARLSTPVPPRSEWLAGAGLVDELHRSFSWLVALSGSVVMYLGLWKNQVRLVNRITLAIVVLILLQVLFGAVLYYLALPPLFQVLHLTFFALLVCAEFLLLLILKMDD